MSRYNFDGFVSSQKHISDEGYASMWTIGVYVVYVRAWKAGGSTECVPYLFFRLLSHPGGGTTGLGGLCKLSA